MHLNFAFIHIDMEELWLLIPTDHIDLYRKISLPFFRLPIFQLQDLNKTILCQKYDKLVFKIMENG